MVVSINQIVLSKEQNKQIEKLYIIGIYKQLHKENLITNDQLKKLIEMEN